MTPPPSAEVCWCGSTAYVPALHPDYWVCRACGSARLLPALVPADLSGVADEKSHLYGENYWEEHQAAIGLPPIEARSRSDLPERCQYWLGHLLRRRLPPGRVLELGCAHGGFVKLLRSAGFDATGLEMSPAVIEASRRRFGIDIRLGPLEAAGADFGRFDVIALFDVLEHVPDPTATVLAIAGHLTDDGVVVIQTPRHDAIADPKWPMYLPPEHTFLYSSAGLTTLLAAAGLMYTAVEPPLFWYDQFVFASRVPLTLHVPETVADRLAATPDGRLVQAMQDLYAQVRTLQNPDPAARFGPRTLAAALLRSLPRSLKRRLKG